MNKNNTQDLQEFAITMQNVFKMFKFDLDVTQDINFLEVWFNLLQDYSIQEVKQAFYKYLTFGKFAPKPSDILELLNIANNKNNTLIAENEWQGVMSAISKVGTYQNIKFNNPITNEVVNIMGWQYLGNMLETSEQFERKRFIELYQQLATQNIQTSDTINIGFYNSNNYVLFDGKKNTHLLTNK